MSSVGRRLVRCAKRRSCYRPFWNAPRTAGRIPTIRDRWARPAGEPAVLFGEQRSTPNFDRANTPTQEGMYPATDHAATTNVDGGVLLTLGVRTPRDRAQPPPTQSPPLISPH